MNCPHCNNLTSPLAKKCAHCGKDIFVTAIRDGSEPVDCPVCNITTKIVDFANMELDVCPLCGGMWFDTDEIKQFQEIISSRELDIGVAQSLRELPTQTSEEKRKHYLNCPVCGEMMLRQNFLGVSGIMLDTCANDGIWIERNNVLRIVDLITSEKIHELTHKSEMSREYEKREHDRRLKEREARQKTRQQELRELAPETDISEADQLKMLSFLPNMFFLFRPYFLLYPILSYALRRVFKRTLNV